MPSPPKTRSRGERQLGSLRQGILRLRRVWGRVTLLGLHIGHRALALLGVLAYVLLGVGYVFVLLWLVPALTWGRAFAITLALLTGGDPYMFQSTLEPCWFTWFFAWVIRVCGWLLIPALVGYLVGQLVVQAQANMVREGLRRSLEGFADNAGELTGHRLTEEQKRELVQRALERLNKPPNRTGRQ